MANEKLSIEDIAVPEFMLDALMIERGMTAQHSSRDFNRRALAAALLELVENPIVPDEEQARELVFVQPTKGAFYARDVAVEWQRRMFLKPKSALPEDVQGLMWTHGEQRAMNIDVIDKIHNNAIAKAYSLGLANRKES